MFDSLSRFSVRYGFFYNRVRSLLGIDRTTRPHFYGLTHMGPKMATEKVSEQAASTSSFAANNNQQVKLQFHRDVTVRQYGNTWVLKSLLSTESKWLNENRGCVEFVTMTSATRLGLLRIWQPISNESMRSRCVTVVTILCQQVNFPTSIFLQCR